MYMYLSIPVSISMHIYVYIYMFVVCNYLQYISDISTCSLVSLYSFKSSSHVLILSLVQPHDAK